MKLPIYFTAFSLALLALNTIHAQNTPPANPTIEKKADEGPFDAREHYTKYEYRIPMRDGAKLFTAVYVPKDASKPYPFLMVRTPYSVSVGDGPRRPGQLRRRSFPARQPPPWPLGGFRPGGIYLCVPGRARTV